MVAKSLKIATRGSRLALAQAEEARLTIDGIIPGLPCLEMETFGSPGDRDQDTPLSDKSVPDDFFTRDLDDALLKGRADIAVHSAKDLPDSMRDGLTIAALLPATEIRDALVFRKDRAKGRPPGVIGTSSPKRNEQIRLVYPEAKTRPLRGTIDQRLEKLDEGGFDAIVIAACALQRLGLEDRIGEYLSYDPVPQQGRLALVTRTCDTELNKALRSVDVRRKAGLVAIIGCPADPAMRSMRSERYLKQADIIFHDRLLPDDIMLAIRDRALPVGKVGGQKSISQPDIHRMMLMEAERGRLIVRLHGGDPCIFAHLSEELDFLTAWNIRVDIVPTVTAAQVAAAHAHASLTHRNDGGGVKFTSGHTPRGSAEERMPGPGEGNLAIYMGVGSTRKLGKRLMDAGWPGDTSIVIGERIGYRDERISTARLDGLTELTIAKPAVFLAGIRTYPSSGYTLFTGTDPEHFLNHGPLIHWPVIKLVSRPVKERTSILDKILPVADGVIFPSRFAVGSFMEALKKQRDVRALAGKKILSVGPSTTMELERYGIIADASADTYGGVSALSEGISDDFAGKYLYPCSDAAPVQQRGNTLRMHGIDICPYIFYSNRVTAYSKLPDIPFGRVLFTSTSTVKAYFDTYPHELEEHRTWLAVGPSTLNALEAMGLSADIIDGE